MLYEVITDDVLELQFYGNILESRSCDRIQSIRRAQSAAQRRDAWYMHSRETGNRKLANLIAHDDLKCDFTIETAPIDMRDPLTLHFLRNNFV